MGTNYYAEYNRCGHCHRYDTAHIGKSRHIVRIYPDGLPNDGTPINGFADWRRFLDDPNVFVRDEYGGDVADSSVELHAWLDSWKQYRTRVRWHQEDRYAGIYEAHGDHLDRNGYHVCAREFS